MKKFWLILKHLFWIDTLADNQMIIEDKLLKLRECAKFKRHSDASKKGHKRRQRAEKLRKDAITQRLRNGT